jgi:hypothetical protein
MQQDRAQYSRGIAIHLQDIRILLHPKASSRLNLSTAVVLLLLKLDLSSLNLLPIGVAVGKIIILPRWHPVHGVLRA